MEVLEGLTSTDLGSALCKRLTSSGGALGKMFPAPIPMDMGLVRSQTKLKERGHETP